MVSQPDYNNMYQNEDDDNDYNNRYDNLPTPDDGIFVSSEEEPIEEEKEEDDDEDYARSETEDEEDQNNKKDNTFDLYKAWDALMEIPDLVFDINALLLDDPDLQDMWANQNGDTDEKEEEEEEEEDEGENNEEEDEELERMISSGDESEESPPPPPREEEEVRTSDADILEEGDDFSFGEIETDPEEVITADGQEDEREEEENEEEQIGENEEGKVEKEPDPAETQKRYRKLPKDSDDSDSTEYETVTEESEKELNDEAEEQNDLDKEESEEKVQEEKPPTPDPYAWIEYSKEIEHIEEYDDDFIQKFYTKYKSSDPSSTDESKSGNDSYDVPVFKLPPSELSVVKNKHSKGKKHERQRKIAVAKLDIADESQKPQDQSVNIKKKNQKGKNDKKVTVNTKQLKYMIDLNVYNFDNYPVYVNSNDDNDKSHVENPNKKLVESETPATPLKSPKSAKQKHYLKHKKRTLLYERLHPWYKTIVDNGKDLPDAEIPSYKAKKKALDTKEKTISITMKKLIDQTMLAVGKIECAKRRKEGMHYCRYIVLKLCDDLVGEIEEKQQREAVRHSIEVLLDKWEEHVYNKKIELIDEQFDKISETLVTSAIQKSVNDIVDEDIFATLLVRDTLAESLDDVGMKRGKITRKLDSMFADYQFETYDFDKGSVTTKVRQKSYKSRKQLDELLTARSRKMVLDRQEKQRKEEKKKEEVRKLKEKKENEVRIQQETKKAILEKKKSFHEEKVKKIELAKRQSQLDEKVVNEESDTDQILKSPLFLSPDASDEEVSYYAQDTHEKIDPEEVAEMAARSRRRATIVTLWCNEDKRLLDSIRMENAQKYLQVDEEESGEEEDKENEENKQVDLNALYANDSEEEGKEDEDGSLEDYNEIALKLPNLNDEVEKALALASTPTQIILLKPGDKKERVDSAIGSDIVTSPPKKKSVAFRHLPRHESGISSTMTLDEEETHVTKAYIKDVLDPTSYEQENTNEEIVKLIPKIDREQYLFNWLQTGVPKVHNPSPPTSTNDKKVRKTLYHLKRPKTALSEESVRDVVPIDDNIYKNLINPGRLNSAMSHERPDTASTFYTARDSLLSKNEDREDIRSNDSIESEAEDNDLKCRRQKRRLKKNTEIKFNVNEQNSKKDEEDDDKTAAWDFYLRQQHQIKKAREQMKRNNENKQPKKASDVNLSKKELLESEKQELLTAYTKVVLDEVFEDDDEELDQEVLQIQQNTSDREDEESVTSISPPGTPWKRKKNRPLTPDSHDSEQELENLKDRYLNGHAKQKQSEKQKNQAERRWKTYLRKKSQAPPPAPKISWKATPGLIPWKNAGDDLKKHEQKGPVESRAQINRELFQKLQIMARNDQRFNQDRLLQRRATLHNSATVSQTKSEQRKKILLNVNNESPPRTSRTAKSIPSYARPTKAAQMKRVEKTDKLPDINKSNRSSAGKRAKCLTGERKGTTVK